MADITTRASVELIVNGRNARKELDDLRKRTEEARKEMDRLAEAGDKKGAQKKAREIRALQNEMRRLQSSAEYFGQTLKMLDKASLKDLRATLRYLTRELEGMERGSAQWNRQAELIRRVRAQIDSVNAALRTQREETQTLRDVFRKWQTAIVAGYAMAAQYVTRLMSVSREAADAYASMDQEMANVRKYTGMSEQDVDALNSDFLKIDTRTSREELNRLAQEAGRLGKTSREDVLGFVRAADKINVALDDIGDGATLTLSKLTGVFGDEKRLGTEKALLSVGSVINELSQNCAASAPYLAEFASRMGGVGAQAGMTVQQIMAFGAVLDSSNQAVEASSTALQQVIVRLLQDPAKYAKVAGLDVKKFSDLVRTDMNAAVIELLETLKKAGGMDVLSPMFKDMGENGSNSIKTLASLADHIEEVKAQQEAANVAFAEATSIDNEFEVQNTTVQASLDKQKKRIAELRVELGEKLLPAVRLANSSAEVSLKVMNATIGFISEHKAALASLVAALVLYRVAVSAVTIATKTAAAMEAGWNVIRNTGRVITVACSYAYYTLTGNIKKATAAQRMFNRAFNSSVWGVVITLISLAVAELISYISKTNKARETERERAKEARKYAEEAEDYSKRAAELCAEETRKLKSLYEAATDETRAREARVDAAKKLIATYPETFSNFNTEQIMIGKARKAYDDLTASILRNAQAKAAAEIVRENEKEILMLQNERDEYSLERKEASADRDKIRARNRASDARASSAAETMTGAIAMSGSPASFARESTAAADERVREATAEMNSRQEKINIKRNANNKLIARFKDNSTFEAEFTRNTGIEVADPEENPNPYTSTVLSEKERKKAEAAARRAAAKARKEFKEELNSVKGDWEAADAGNIADYSQGLKSWTEFLTEKHRLQEKFYDDQMAVFERHNLQEDEDYQELLKKKEQLNADWLKRKAAMTVDEAKLAQKAEEVQAQIDFSTPGNALFQKEEALQIRLFDIRIKYLRKMREAYNRDSEEYHNLSVQISEAEQQEKLRLGKRYAELVAKYSTEYQKKSAKEQFDYQIQMLTALQQAGQLSMKDYMKAVAALRKEAVEDQLPESARKTESAENADSHAMNKDLEAIKANFDARLMTEEEYLKARDRIEDYYQKRALERARQSADGFGAMAIEIYQAFKALAEDGDDNMWSKIGNAAQATYALISAAMSAYSDYSQAELDLQVARVEKRYDREYALAEGNVYKQKQAEKKKQKEIAKAKNDANRKQFAMSVISAVAQTAMNAISAYGAGLQVGGPAGLVLAPIAAAMAIAAGMIQIATLRKQQQASEAQGYMQGGFTPKGRRDEPVGVVHAGEWVAPQEMVNSPATRPIINMLENARRNNRTLSISHADVSAAISAPAAAARAASRPVVIESPTPTPQLPDPALASTLDRLNERLSQPFVTVNTVTGKHGYRQAEEEYDRLMRNKSFR